MSLRASSSLAKAGQVRMAGLQLLGRHVGQRAAEVGGWVGTGDVIAEADVEVGQLGDALRGQKHVRRLDVAMQDAVLGGVVECLGEPTAEPCHGFRPRQGGDALANAGIARAWGLLPQRGVDGFDHQLAAPHPRGCRASPA